MTGVHTHTSTYIPMRSVSIYTNSVKELNIRDIFQCQSNHSFRIAYKLTQDAV